MATEETTMQTGDTAKTDEQANKATEETQETGNTPKTFSQEDLDRILSDRLARDRAKLEKDITNKVKKEQEERQLLEDQKWKELAERREAELLELQKLQETVEHEKKVNALLDKKEVVDPGFRKIFSAMNGLELQELSDTVDSFNTIFTSAVEKAVALRLGNNSPSKANGSTNVGSKPISEMTDTEKVALVKEIGQKAYGEKIMAEYAK